MTKIVERINFYTAMGNQVRLHDHYYNEADNAGRMTHYMPIKSHREAFLTLAKAQLPDPNNKDKVFMLTGSYGTGKSHLCLMLANYFSKKPTNPDMVSFFENWAQRDQAGANQVRQIRGNGRYLVAICEYGEGKTFVDMVLSAIEEALQVEGFEEMTLDTQFKGALRWIMNLEKRRSEGEASGVFDDFISNLDSTNSIVELESLKAGLQRNNPVDLERFQLAYEKATLARFTFKNESLNEVLEDLISNPAFEERYRGLVILADEFGYALSDGKVPLAAFQSFAEMSKDGVNGLPIIFVGTGHRRFEAYGAGTHQAIDFLVLKDRVTEVSLQSEELEQIISALIAPKPEVKDEISENWLVTKMVTETVNARLFNYLGGTTEIKENIVTNIYPMHPLAVYGLTRLSQELGSDARSVFSFFRQIRDNAAPGGYQWFVEKNDVTKANGDLSIYTADNLIEYFKPEINSSNLSVRPEVHDHIRNYLAAMEEAEKAARNDFVQTLDPFTKSILNLMFVFKVSGFPVRAANILFGLNLYKNEERSALESAIKELKENKVIFMGDSGELEFRRSNMADIDDFLARTRAELVKNPLDPAEQITKIAGTRFENMTVALEHNAAYHGDKRLKRVFATSTDLLRKITLQDGSEQTFWQRLENERNIDRGWNEQYEGVMVYVLCDDDEDILTAQQAVRGNNFENIIVAIPSIPIPVRSKILDYLAVREFMDSLDYNRLDPQEKSLVEEKLGKESSRSGRIGEVMKLREKYLSSENLVWYKKNGSVLIRDTNSEHEAADLLMNTLYIKRNQAEHIIFNQCHPRNQNFQRDSALKTAISSLIAFERPVEIDPNESENTGEIRYLRNVLVNNGVLKQSSDYIGHSIQYQLEENIESFRSRIPAMVEMIEYLRGLSSGTKVPLWPKLQELIDPPYGVGPYALSILLAVAIRYQGDEIRLKINPVNLGYSPLDNPEIIIELATGRYRTAVIERQIRTPEVQKTIDGVYDLFSEQPIGAGMHCFRQDAWSALHGWWSRRTRLEKTSGIYVEGSTGRKLVEFMTNSEANRTAGQTFLDEIKVVYGFCADAELEPDQIEDMLERIRSDKLIIETRADDIKDSVISSIGSLFAPDGLTYLDFTDGIRKWIANLHPEQRNRRNQAYTDLQTAVTLLDALQAMTELKQSLLVEIPASASFGFGEVDAWNYDRSEEYITKIRTAKNKIDDALPKVADPKWVTSVPASDDSTGPIVTYHTRVVLKVEAPEGVTVRVTAGDDPTTAKQFEAIASGNKWSQIITGSCTYQMVSQNEEREFGRVIKVDFRDLDDDYQLIPEGQPVLNPADRFFTFRNPVDKASLSALLKSLIDQLKSDDLISQDDIATTLKETIEVIKRED